MLFSTVLYREKYLDNELYSRIKEQQSIIDELETFSGTHSYQLDVKEDHDLHNTNTLLMTLNESPIKSQTIVRLEEQAPSSIRRLTAKLRHSVAASASVFAEKIAPGQGKMLLELAQLDDLSERRSSTSSRSSKTPIDEEHLQYLIYMYHAYEKQHLPYQEQIRVLTLIPKSWKLSSPIIQQKFHCTDHAVKLARKLGKSSCTPLHMEVKAPKTRQRLELQKLDYFISWLIEADLLISIPWGNTNLKLENGQVISIPKQMLQAQQSQIVHLYQNHCNKLNISSMSDRTVYSILQNLNASEKKVISGIDEFVKDASEGWLNLKKIIQQLHLSNEHKTKLNTMLEKSNLYLKSKYRCHCNETEQTTTHCTVFALSQANNSCYSQSCDHAHDTFCEGTDEKLYLTIQNFYI
ncbi:unnamed protein product [Rotaria sp. Silwood2]|nr:unnamed protein product [Rotaria sp. Silwood2]CAF4591178.1 unnamed protein product [Rotaria sp. Silwood2]